MGNVNVVEGYCYRLKNNHGDITSLSCCDEGLVNIGDEGAQEIAFALAFNNTLTTLDMGGMDIGNGGAEALSQALVLNKTLEVLRLHRNKISDAGAEKLVAALRHNHHVTALYIAMNVIENENLNEEIQKLCKLNKLGPQEAARMKQELYSPGWVAEGAELKREAEDELRRHEEEAMAEMTVATSEPPPQTCSKYPPIVCNISYSRGQAYHTKSD